MGHRPCCRSCRHCTPPSGGDMGWCQIRQLAIHPELVSDLWCHHWTARPPRLPVLGERPPSPVSGGAPANQQLSLTAMLKEG